jgi:hypothetical protein
MVNRHHLADRDQRQRIEPAELGAEMDGVARDVLRQAPRPHGGQAAGAIDQWGKQQEADAAADQHHLEHVELMQRLAAGDRDHQHQGEPAGHPQRGHRFGGGAFHRRRKFESGQAGMFDVGCLCNAQICRGSTARGLNFAVGSWT